MSRKKTDVDDVRRIGDFDDESPRARNRTARGAVWVVLVVVLLAGAYAGGAWYLQDKVPAGTTVMGVDIGGLDEQAATERLQSEIGDHADPVTVAVGDKVAQIDPAGASLALDLPATVRSLTSYTLDPRVLWERLTGSAGEVEPRTTVDDAALAAAVDGVAGDLQTEAVDGSITFADGAAQVSQPVDGTEVDVDGAVAAIEENWLTATDPIELPTIAVAPTIDQAMIDTAMTDQVDPLLAAPVTLTVGDVSVELAPSDLANAASMTVTDGAYDLVLDPEALKARLVEIQPELGATGTDAQIVIQDGAPTIIPAIPGQGVAGDALVTAVESALTAPDRTADVPLSEEDAEFSTADAEALGIVEAVSEFHTPLASDNVRTQNLIAGTAIINGDIVRPGEQFSLLSALGPVDAAHGFVESGVVENGFSSTAMGGGLSQLSTTTYNAAFFSGMDLIDHKPHSRWFSRYPEGREATLWDPSVDMIFQNSTPYGVLIQAWVENGEVWVRFWSTHYFDVTDSTSARYNFTSPQTLYNPDPQCIAESGGQQGFSVDITRQRYLDGTLFSDESWSWTYSPWNRVICGSAPTN